MKHFVKCPKCGRSDWVEANSIFLTESVICICEHKFVIQEYITKEGSCWRIREKQK